MEKWPRRCGATEREQMSFKEIQLADLSLNPFTKIEEWALLTVGDKQQFNIMTIRGIMLGLLWFKKTLLVYFHPAIYSY
jgi:hypothetical protein